MEKIAGVEQKEPLFGGDIIFPFIQQTAVPCGAAEKDQKRVIYRTVGNLHRSHFRRQKSERFRDHTGKFPRYAGEIPDRVAQHFRIHSADRICGKFFC